MRRREGDTGGGGRRRWIGQNSRTSPPNIEQRPVRNSKQTPAGLQVLPADLFSTGRARAEIVYRDREYAEEQERSRREFEREVSAAADAREARRQKFDEELAQRQMDHASKLAREQLGTAQAAARAATMAAWAAGVAALGAIGQLVVAIVR